MMTPTLPRLALDQAIWSQSVFGADDVRGPIGALKHLAKEAHEAIAKPGDIFEYADCLLLILDASRRAGFSSRDLVQAAHDKLQANKERQWPTPTSDEPVEHVREPAPATKLPPTPSHALSHACSVCGADTPLGWAVPRHNGDLVSNAFAGEWAASPACPRCHDAHAAGRLVTCDHLYAPATPPDGVAVATPDEARELYEANHG